MDKKIELRKLTELKTHPKNPRDITKEKSIELRERIRKFGQLGLILVDGRDKTTILGGNHVFEEMKKLGYTEAWVEYRTPADDAEALELLIVHNEKFASWVAKDLSKLLYEYKEKIDLSKYSIDLGRGTDLKKLLARYGMTDEDNFDVQKELPEEAKSVEGKVYQLGRHRVMCGDSTNPEHIKKLLGDIKVHLVVTDPPYGVSYEGAVNSKDWDMIKNDDLREEDLERFLVRAFENPVPNMIKGCPAYVFYASRNHINFESALRVAGFTVRQQLIWYKYIVVGMADYHWTHEPILYCQYGKERPPFYGDRTHRTVIETASTDEMLKMKKEDLVNAIVKMRENITILKAGQERGKKYMHPTQKPIAILTPLIKNSSAVGDNVLDLFGGSGSTMVTADQLDRTAYLMELDPRYVDVIRKRYANLQEDLENWEDLTPEALD